MIEIGCLRAADRAVWEVLARGYKDFYRTVVPDEGYEQTWRRLRESPPPDPDSFTGAVFEAEGMDPHQYEQLHRQVRDKIDQRMRSWATG